jgi:hypothetical protein
MMEALRIKRMNLQSKLIALQNEITKLKRAEHHPVVQCLYAIMPNLDVLEIIIEYCHLWVCENCSVCGIRSFGCLSCRANYGKERVDFEEGLFIEKNSLLLYKADICDFLRNIKCKDENEQEILDYILDHNTFNQVFLGDNINDGWNDFVVVVRFTISQYTNHSSLISFEVK